MIPEVRVSEFVATKIASEYSPERDPRGRPSEFDFWAGPLAAARFGFRDFENFPFVRDSRIRTLHVVDPMFGAVEFVGVLVEAGVVEIADCGADPDYWELISCDPDD